MGTKENEDEAAVISKIAGLTSFRGVAERLHALVRENAPELRPRLWYGMPGYAPTRSKPVVCFFRVDGDEHVTFGLTEKANLVPEDGGPAHLLPSAWFLTGLDEATEARIASIVRRAAR